MAKKGYWIASIMVSDDERYKDYIAIATPAYEQYGAKFLARGGECINAEGNWNPRNVVIEFPSYQHAQDCYYSPQYEKARVIRQEVSRGNVMIIEGYE